MVPTLQLECTVPGSDLSRLAGMCFLMGNQGDPIVLGLDNNKAAEALLNTVSCVLAQFYQQS